MDPYLEDPSLWPDVHNRLIAALGDVITPLVAPRYYVGLEQHTYFFTPDDLEVIFLGRPDLTVVDTRAESGTSTAPHSADVSVLEVGVPLVDEVHESFLEVRETASREVVTILELLSPANKVHRKGRQEYEEKRLRAFQTRTSLVEIDLLRTGDPMPVIGDAPARGYRILVSRGARRPRAQLYVFGVRDPIPPFPLPLLAGDEEPLVPLGDVLHSLYDRARFDLRLDYSRPPVPPLEGDDAQWATELVKA